MALPYWSTLGVHRDHPVAVASPAAAGYVAAVLCWALSAGVYVAAKWVAPEMPPWALCFWRLAIAGAVLVPLVRHDLAAIGATIRARPLDLLLIGGLGLAITQGFIYVGLGGTSAINAGLIIALMPLVTMVLARFVLGEGLSLGQGAGAAVAFVGMAVIVVHGDLAALLRLEVSEGELWIVGAAVAFALYTVLLRRARFDLPRLPLLVALIAAAAIVALPIYAWEIPQDERTALDARGMLALAYVAIPGGAGMYYLFNWSVESLGAARAGSFLYLQAVFIAVLAWLLLGESLHVYHFAGAALIALGVLLATGLSTRPSS